MKLTRITLVNWYLYNPVDIDIKGNTALIGVNGTGKSTILDAIQVVLFGGNMNLVRFNAKAASSSSKNLRSLKSYCSGTYYPAGNDKEPRSLRKDAESYLALSFEGGRDGKIINLFMAIETRFDEPKADIRLLAVGRNDRPLSYTDFVTTKGDNYTVTNIDDIQTRLKVSGFDFKNCQNSREYIHEMTLLLGPDRSTGEAITPEVLSSTLSKSLSIGEIDSISSFAKRFILEDAPLNVQSVINARNQYREILKQIKDDERRLEELRPIANGLLRVLKKQKDSVALYWLYFEEKLAEIEAQLGDLTNERESLIKAYRSNKAESKVVQGKIEEMDSSIDGLKKTIAINDQKQQLDDLNLKIDGLDEVILDLKSKQFSLANNLKSFSSYDFAAALGQDSMVKTLATLSELLEDDEQPNVKKIDSILTDLPQIVPKVQTAAEEKWLTLSQRKKEIEKESNALYNQIESAESGRVTLLDKTERVIEALARNGIAATPLCQLATVNEPRWQKAIEAVLGNKTEALIVDPKDQVEALRTYRKMRSENGAEIYNVTIVRTDKTKEWLGRFSKGSAAEIIHSDNEYARAFLQNQLGTFMLVETEKELTQHNRAMTPDGMISTQSSSTRNRLPTKLKMVADPSVNLPVLRGELEKIDKERTQNEPLEKKAKAIYDSAVNIQRFLVEFSPLSFTHFKTTISEKADSREKIQKQIDEMDLTTLSKQEQDLKDAESELKALKAQQLRLATEKGSTLTSSKSAKASFLKIDKLERPQLEATRKIFKDHPDFDQQRADTLYQELSDSTPDNINSKALQAKNDAQRALDITKEKLHVYLINIDSFLDVNADKLTMESLNSITERVNSHLKFIEADSLAAHKQSAERAEQQMNQSFRSDMVNKLKAAFDDMNSQFQVINRSLESCQFHGSKYRFKATEKKEYAELIKFIKSVSEDDSENVGSMFDSTPEDIKKDIDRLINGEAEGLSMIEDYREYFEYDVQITNLTSGDKTMLSTLGGFGSGGENQAPFYITLASALSSAWKTLKRPGESLGLTLLDEAFNNLSEDNLVNAKDYMNRVGLQVIVAAPSDREPTFRTMVDTFVYISREGEAVEITVDYIKEEGREILTSQNPNLNPELVEAALAANA